MKNVRLEEHLHTLRGSRSPRTDLWPGIERAMEERRHRKSRPHGIVPFVAGALAGAAGVCLAILVFTRPPVDSDVAIYTALRRMGSTWSEEEIQRQYDELKRSEREYEEAKQDLMHRLRQLAGVCGEEAVGSIERRLERVDQAITAVKTALGAEPQQSGRLSRLVALYGTQTRALSETAALVQSIRK